MFHFENSIIIDRPIEEVFALVVDLPSIPKWNYYHPVAVTTVQYMSDSAAVCRDWHCAPKGHYSLSSPSVRSGRFV
jgi:uncharacterized membrane protein